MEYFPRYWPFVGGNSPVTGEFPRNGQWRGALMFSLICARVNNREAGDLRRCRTHYDVTVMNTANDICTLEEEMNSQFGSVHALVIIKYIDMSFMHFPMWNMEYISVRLMNSRIHL